MLAGFCLSDSIALLLGIEHVGGLCLSDSITLLLGYEYVGWSVFVRRHNSTRGT
jgi:hypothetical protein